jgi:hypothetical protein
VSDLCQPKKAHVLSSQAVRSFDFNLITAYNQLSQEDRIWCRGWRPTTVRVAACVLIDTMVEVPSTRVAGTTRPNQYFRSLCDFCDSPGGMFGQRRDVAVV